MNPDISGFFNSALLKESHNQNHTFKPHHKNSTMSAINEITQAEMQEYIRSVQTLLSTITDAVERFKHAQSPQMLDLPFPDFDFDFNLETDMDRIVSIYAKRGYGHVQCDLDLLELVLGTMYRPNGQKRNIAKSMVNDIDAHIGNLATQLGQKVVLMTKGELMATFVSPEINGKNWVLGPLIITSAHPLATRFREVFEDALMFFTTGKSHLVHSGSEYFHMTMGEIGSQVSYRIEMVYEDEE